jgi:V/A-type H+-transporting ATPase subunit K
MLQAMKEQKRRVRLTNKTVLLLVPFLITLALVSFHVVASLAQEPQTQTPSTRTAGDLIAASIAVGLSGIGAGIAIYGSTSAGMAAAVERPELTTWVLVFAGLGEGIAIYGLVVAIMILGKL